MFVVLQSKKIVNCPECNSSIIYLFGNHKNSILLVCIIQIPKKWFLIMLYSSVFLGQRVTSDEKKKKREGKVSQTKKCVEVLKYIVKEFADLGVKPAHL